VVCFRCGPGRAASRDRQVPDRKEQQVSLTATDRERVRQAIDAATRAGLRPARNAARPGHPSRFTSVVTVVNYGHEVIRPSLTDYDQWSIRRPKILQALNG